MIVITDPPVKIGEHRMPSLVPPSQVYGSSDSFLLGPASPLLSGSYFGRAPVGRPFGGRTIGDQMVRRRRGLG